MTEHPEHYYTLNSKITARINLAKLAEAYPIESIFNTIEKIHVGKNPIQELDSNSLLVETHIDRTKLFDGNETPTQIKEEFIYGIKQDYYSKICWLQENYLNKHGIINNTDRTIKHTLGLQTTNITTTITASEITKQTLQQQEDIETRLNFYKKETNT